MLNVSEVKQRIAQLQRMSDLPPDDFAEEGGLADSLAGAFGDALKPTQLRKIFTEIKLIQRQVDREARTEEKRQEPFDRTKLLKLMPTMAYAVGRKLLPGEFYEVLKLIFDRRRLKTNADFLRAADLVEAVMAYHKYRKA